MTGKAPLTTPRGERGCPSVSVGGLRCQYPEGHQLSHGYRGAEWSVGRDFVPPGKAAQPTLLARGSYV